MTTAEVPDIEKAVAKYLREVTDLRVVAHPPDGSDRDRPWVMYTLIQAPRAAGSSVDHVIHFRIQFDCYCGREGGLPEAQGQYRQVRAVMCDMPAAEHDGVVVTNVHIDGGHRMRETSMEPARDRYTFDTVVTAHAV